jgi:hypothetical protein
VEVLTVHRGTPVKEQAKIFRTFDILITPHGSHLMNMIFAPNQIGVIEVAPINHDSVFRDGSRSLHVRFYAISTGHQPASKDSARIACRGDEFSDLLHEHCERDINSEWSCPKTWSSKWIPCDMVVDTAALNSHITKAIEMLCMSPNQK